MELVVGASEATMKSLLGKLGGLLAQEYNLIRGVNGDLQYINDELATMQSFLHELTVVGGSHGHGPLMKDWMKQIRDITYDIEDCIDDSGHRLHGLRSDMCCYFLANSVYEVLTWWPRRDVASRISVLKMRAQQIGERRERYGVNNPESGVNGAGPRSTAAVFDAAGNQYANLQLVATKDPVGVEEYMGKLGRWVIDNSSSDVMYIVGFGGVGKTTIATALYRKYGAEFDHRAKVAVSQSSDLEAVLTSIKRQVIKQTDDQDKQDCSADNRVAAAVKGVRDRVGRGASAVMAKLCNAGTSEETHDRAKLDRLKIDLEKHLENNRRRPFAGGYEGSSIRIWSRKLDSNGPSFGDRRLIERGCSVVGAVGRVCNDSVAVACVALGSSLVGACWLAIASVAVDVGFLLGMSLFAARNPGP